MVENLMREPKCRVVDLAPQMSSFSVHMSGALLLESRDGDTLDMQLRRTAARVTAEELAADQSRPGGECPVDAEPREDGAAAAPCGGQGFDVGAGANQASSC